MTEQKTPTKRKKPTFTRKDWHKKIKLGSTVKKKRKWRAAKGRQNKIRLGRKGHAQRPKIGWSAAKILKGLIQGKKTMRIENKKQLETVPKGTAIIIASIGKKKKQEIITAAKEKNITIINNKGETKHATK
jgi:ribosomal protein L32E